MLLGELFRDSAAPGSERFADVIGIMTRSVRVERICHVQSLRLLIGAPPPPPHPPPRTKWTRRVPHPVLIGHAASLTPY